MIAALKSHKTNETLSILARRTTCRLITNLASIKAIKAINTAKRSSPTSG